MFEVLPFAQRECVTWQTDEHFGSGRIVTDEKSLAKVSKMVVDATTGAASDDDDQTDGDGGSGGDDSDDDAHGDKHASNARPLLRAFVAAAIGHDPSQVEWDRASALVDSVVWNNDGSVNVPDIARLCWAALFGDDDGTIASLYEATLTARAAIGTLAPEGEDVPLGVLDYMRKEDDEKVDLPPPTLAEFVHLLLLANVPEQLSDEQRQRLADVHQPAFGVGQQAKVEKTVLFRHAQSVLCGRRSPSVSKWRSVHVAIEKLAADGSISGRVLDSTHHDWCVQRQRAGRLEIKVGADPIKWLAEHQRLPITVRPAVTEAERRLFTELYLMLSKNGTRSVDFGVMAELRNDRVVQELESQTNNETRRSELRLKTPALLVQFSEKLDSRLKANAAIQPHRAAYQALLDRIRATATSTVAAAAPQTRDTDDQVDPNYVRDDARALPELVGNSITLGGLAAAVGASIVPPSTFRPPHVAEAKDDNGLAARDRDDGSAGGEGGGVLPTTTAKLAMVVVHMVEWRWMKASFHPHPTTTTTAAAMTAMAVTAAVVVAPHPLLLLGLGGGATRPPLPQSTTAQTRRGRESGRSEPAWDACDQHTGH